MDESFSSFNRTGDERKIGLQAAERLKAFHDSIVEEMEYLPDNYYFLLSPLISAYGADIDEYEKLVVNDDFEGKEKCLSAVLLSLQQRQISFRGAVLSAYKSVVSGSSGDSTAEAEKHTLQALAQLPKSDSGGTSQDIGEVAVLQTENSSKNESLKNGILLDTIHAALLQIESAISLAEQAVKKNKVSNIQLYTSHIADAALKISGLSLLLDAKGKENLYVLAVSLQHAAENLRKLVKKNALARSEIANGISEMKIKFSSLSTGISFVKG